MADKTTVRKLVIGDRALPEYLFALKGLMSGAILEDMSMSDGGGLNLTVTDGFFLLAGFLIEYNESIVVLFDDDTNYIYLELNEIPDPNTAKLDNISYGVYARTTDVGQGDYNIKLGQVTTASGSISLISAGNDVHDMLNLFNDVRWRGFLTPVNADELATKGYADSLVSGISSGTTFPGTPSDGDFFYRTDLDHLFRYDAGRTKWLGEQDLEIAGRNGFLAVNSYLRRIDGMAMSASLGTYIPYDITITGITFVKGNANSGTIEVRRNGVLVAGAALATGAATSGASLTLDNLFASAGIMSIYWNSANSTTDMQVKIYYRRRAT